MTRTTTYALMTVALIAAVVACPSLADARGGFGGHGGGFSGGHGRSSSHGMQRRVTNSPTRQHGKSFGQSAGQTGHGTQTQPGNTAPGSGKHSSTHNTGGAKPPTGPVGPVQPPVNPPHHPPYFPPHYPPYHGGGFVGGTGTVVQSAYAPVAASGIDLELLEVRQLDRGYLARNLGPAYRVMFRSRTGAAVTQPFDVGLAASIGRQANAESAFAVTRVDGLAAGQTLTVEIRLPADALNLGQNADGQPVPFGFLTAVADANQELPEADRTNDFMTLRRGGIVMVVHK